ncbi:hypothetical protein FOZ61_002379 [Perkinsus olseni]|uniref:Uncharacterized protein n=1 Tax=Perkinsus olseni TaxID=32597 RepID=A0A7J6M900_PEROL|nr:hypothetical protein FOZ61_002379 [Perkinsus olseni]KAF4667975.1 hypothetical protein FOL46_002251 [Perkinsus olseni]
MVDSQTTVFRILIDAEGPPGSILLTGEGCIRLDRGPGMGLMVYDELIGDSVSPSPSEFFSDGSEQEFDLLNVYSGPSSSRGSGQDVSFVTIDATTGYVEARRSIFASAECRDQAERADEFSGKLPAGSGGMRELVVLSLDEASHPRVCADLRRILTTDQPKGSVEPVIAGVVSNLLQGSVVGKEILEMILKRDELRLSICPRVAEMILERAKRECWHRVVGLVVPLLGRRLDDSEQGEILGSVQCVEDLKTVIVSSLEMPPQVQTDCAESLLEKVEGVPSAELVERVCEGNLVSCCCLLEAYPKLVTPCLKEALRRTEDGTKIPSRLGRLVYTMGLKDSLLAVDLCAASCSLLKDVLEVILVERRADLENVKTSGALAGGRSGDLLTAIVTHCLPELSDKLLPRTDISTMIVSILSDLLEPLNSVHDASLGRCLATVIALCSRQLIHWKAVSRASASLKEAQESVPVSLAEAGLADLAILLLGSPPVEGGEKSALTALHYLFAELPTAAVFALQQDTLPVVVESLAGRAIRSCPRGILEGGDPEVLALAVEALIERRQLEVLECLLWEAPLEVAKLLFARKCNSDAVRMICEVALCDPKPDLLDLLRRQPEDSSGTIRGTLRVCEARLGRMGTARA